MINFIPGIYRVDQGHRMIIERFGKYQKTLMPGLHFVIPFLDTPKDFSSWEGTAVKCGFASAYLMELTEQQLETEFCRCQTKDKVGVDATTVIYFKIVDPIKAAYTVDVLPKTLSRVCAQVLRTEIGAYDFDELFRKRAAISQKVTAELAVKTKSWGINLSEVVIGKVNYDQELQKALQTKRIAEATKEAKIIEAESSASAALTVAETQLKVSKLEKEIKKNEMHGLSELVKKVGIEGAVRLTAAAQSKELLKAVAGNCKFVVLPADFKGILQPAL